MKPLVLSEPYFAGLNFINMNLAVSAPLVVKAHGG
jgi:hypothetical protein